MPDFGSPVAQNVVTPSFTSTLGGLMDLRAKQQQLQVGANAAQAAQQTQQERQRITGMMSSGVDDQGNSIRNEAGEPDPAKIIPALGRMAPLTGQQVAQSILQTHTAATALKTAGMTLGTTQRAAIAGPIQAIATNPTDPGMVDKASTAIDQWAQEHPEMKGIAANAQLLIGHIKTATDPAQRAHLANSLSAMLQGGQAVQTQPQAGSMDNGQTVQPGTVAPPVAGGGFSATDPAIQKQPPPTTPVVDENLKPTLYGARPPLTPNSPPVATGAAPGAAEGITGPVATNNQHFATVQADAQGAANRVAALQTIKQEVPAAITSGGTGGDFIRNVYRVLNPQGDANTAQDVMAKNLAVLAAQSGNTDAARTLGEMGTPGFHMTKEAAQKTADQLIGIEAKKQAAQSYFTGTPTNSALYGEKLKQWNTNADPRAFEFANKSPADQAAMKAEMKKAGTWDALRRKMVGLHDMGVNP